MEYEPKSYQHLRTTNDRNGNPRRVFCVYSEDGRLLDAIDEGYAGRPQWLRGLVEIPSFDILPSEYQRLMRWTKDNTRSNG